MAASEPLRATLIFNGARVRHLRRDLERRSLDLDRRLATEFARESTGLKVPADFLRSARGTALDRGGCGQRVVRDAVERGTLKSREDPLGRDRHAAAIRLHDGQCAGVPGLPRPRNRRRRARTAPGHAVGDLTIGDHTIWASTLARIAGKTLRAFLVSLPACRRKAKKPCEATRVKVPDDPTRMRRARPRSDREFRGKGAGDFRLACAPRCSDCDSLDPFRPNRPATEQAFTSDPTRPTDVTFAEVEAPLTAFVGFRLREKIRSWSFPLPPAARPRGWPSGETVRAPPARRVRLPGLFAVGEMPREDV